MSDTTTYQGPNRVFSGIQPTGSLHLGNYLGALKKFVDLQESGWDGIYCVVDLHALTQDHDPAELADQTRQITAAMLACGLSPEKSIIFAQSTVTAHVELSWIFNCVARMGWLEKMTQFKDKGGENSERVSVGLFDYPVLQAADILVYRATHVPVGEDQQQHLELSRNIAARFNQTYGVEGFFPLPEGMIKGPGARIMSLKDGTKKMSKSDPADTSRINLIDDADTISRKIKKSKTDALGDLPAELSELEGRPEVQNLIGIYAALSGQTDADVLSEYGGQGFGRFKPALAELAVEKLAPITASMRTYLDDPAELDRVLSTGAVAARAVADPILKEVKDVVGFWQP